MTAPLQLGAQVLVRDAAWRFRMVQALGPGCALVELLPANGEAPGLHHPSLCLAPPAGVRAVTGDWTA